VYRLFAQRETGAIRAAAMINREGRNFIGDSLLIDIGIVIQKCCAYQTPSFAGRFPKAVLR
jgi:hypothetical protein